MYVKFLNNEWVLGWKVGIDEMGFFFVFYIEYFRQFLEFFKNLYCIIMIIFEDQNDSDDEILNFLNQKILLLEKGDKKVEYGRYDQFGQFEMSEILIQMNNGNLIEEFIQRFWIGFLVNVLSFKILCIIWRIVLIVCGIFLGVLFCGGFFFICVYSFGYIYRVLGIIMGVVFFLVLIGVVGS